MINFKAKALEMAMQTAPIQDSTTIFVEIGCIREDHEVPSDGYSTVHMARYCIEHDLQFVSVDANEENVAIARTALRKELGGSASPLPGAPVVIHLDGEKYLKACNPISFLYLDSHRDPEYSLNQFLVANLVPGAVVAIDDAHPYDGWEYGKATDLIKLFDAEEIKWKIVPTHPQFKMVIARIVDGWPKSTESHA